MVEQATRYHADIGQYLLLGLIGLHLLAILYVLIRRQTLVRPMIGGDKQLPSAAPSARDDRVTASPRAPCWARVRRRAGGYRDCAL